MRDSEAHCNVLDRVVLSVRDPSPSHLGLLLRSPDAPPCRLYQQTE